MRCNFNNTDHPFRAKKKKSEIIHACRTGRGWLLSACGLYFQFPEEKARDSSRITCVTCQTALGFHVKEHDNIRYLIMDVSTDTFLNRDKVAARWVNDPTNATYWLTKTDAEHILYNIICHRLYSTFGADKPPGWGEYRKSLEKTLQVKKAAISVSIIC